MEEICHRQISLILFLYSVCCYMVSYGKFSVNSEQLAMKAYIAHDANLTAD